MLDFRIQTFLVVCNCMNYTKAAEQLSITQPGVSQHIRFLEEYYEVKLFHFEGKKLSLTPAGEVLYQTALTMTQDEKHLKELMGKSEDQSVKLNFGATLTIGEFVLPPKIKKYLEKNKDHSLSMQIGNTSELVNKLRMGEIDFAFVEGNYPQEWFSHLLFSEERFILVCGKDYDFSCIPVAIKDLFQERILVRERGSGTREVLENYLKVCNNRIEDFTNLIEIGGMNAIKDMVIAGTGITFLYEAAVKDELKNGTLKEIKISGFDIVHDFAFIWNKGSVFSREYEKICFELKGM